MAKKNMIKKRETIEGIVFVIVTYIIWGLLPLYWVLLRDVDPIEILMQRIFWSFIATGLILLFIDFKGFIYKLKRMWRERTPFLLAVASGLVIGFNWTTYIWAMLNNKVLDASIGYYINPVFTIALGAIVLKEKLSKRQKFAIFISAIGVLVIIVYTGSLPWVSIILPLTFGTYGLIKKRLPLKALESLFFECGVLMPIVVPVLLYFQMHSMSSFGFNKTGLFLMISGPLTAIPLVLFAAALKRINLSDVGILQYLSPTISFCVGAFILGEPVNVSYLIALGLIWIGIIVYLSSFFDSSQKTSDETN